MTGGGMPRTQEVWPFAITRSVNTGFRIVVAPGFLVLYDQHHLLADVAGGDVSDEHVYLREYRDHGTQSLWLLYRVVYLLGADVGQDGEFALHGSRRTPLVEGVVCRDRPSGATGELFETVRRNCAEPLRLFFTSDSGTYPVHPSEPVEAVLDDGSPLRVEEEPAYRSERNVQAALQGRRHPPATSWHVGRDGVRAGTAGERAAARRPGDGRTGAAAAGAGADRGRGAGARLRRRVGGPARVIRERPVVVGACVLAAASVCALIVLLLRYRAGHFGAPCT
ncbi:hypothetical protein ACH4GK_15905 [Streptomyces rimosus]|uniref:hypothetical protein n=1 Tax=Streptomyces rimosus TaxID=1927 RepID=UPI00131B5A39|nr:hypothetical protein [Streptomyces rimosus]